MVIGYTLEVLEYVRDRVNVYECMLVQMCCMLNIHRANLLCVDSGV